MIRTTPTTTTPNADAKRQGPAASTCEVVTPAAGDRSAWSALTACTPNATVFHHPDWCDGVVAAFGHTPRHLVARRDGQVVGVLPLVEVNSRLSGRLLVSVPYGNAGGIVARDEDVCVALGRAAAALAVERQARVLDLRSPVAQVPDFAAVEGYVGFVRELPLHPNDLTTFLPRKARAAARHCQERPGVQVQHDGRLLPLVWRLYCRSMRRLASLNYPLRFFTELRRRLGERLWVTVVWQDRRPVAGTVSLVFHDTVTPYIVGTDDRVRCDGAANLLYWSVAERAVRAGLRRFDFGRSRAGNAGSVSFKKHQGFEPEPLGYQRFVPPGATAPDLKPTNPRFALARKVWRHLPLPLTTRLGAWVAHAIPG